MTSQVPAGNGTVVIINGESLGSGDDGLGVKLMTKFLATLATVDPKPDALVLYNAAVRLLSAESEPLPLYADPCQDDGERGTLWT